MSAVIESTELVLDIYNLFLKGKSKGNL